MSRKADRWSGGRLPDGRSTKSDQVYVREWRHFGECVCRALSEGSGEPDFRATACDPGVQVYSPGGHAPEFDAFTARVLARFGGWKH